MPTITKEFVIREKIFAVYLNGELFAHSFNTQDVKFLFSKMVKQGYAGDYSVVDTRFGKFTVLEDEYVIHQSDSVGNEYGEAYHDVLTDLQGNILVDSLRGDLCGPMPNAYESPKEVVARQKMYWLK